MLAGGRHVALACAAIDNGVMTITGTGNGYGSVLVGRRH
jgi:hypothetical protein